MLSIYEARERGEWVRTLAEIDDSPPGPLLLEPGGPTLAYAAPGTGKGMTGAWMITELQALGMQPMIYDAERRPREWASGCRAGW